MSREPSFMTRNTIDFRLRNLVLQGSPHIDIALNNSHGPHGAYITSYSTMDKIEGTVSIQAKNDTRFDELEISFAGTTKTFVDKVTYAGAGSGRSEAKHRFLKLLQPILEEDLPQPRIMEAGKTYKFPFTFVVPQQLLPRSCAHRVANDQVTEAHLQLPPSLGDPALSGFGGTLLDDLAPEMSRVSYAIEVRISRETEGGREILLGEQSRKVRIKPAFEEQPPLSLEKNVDYCDRAEKSVRKGLFKGKLGSLVIESEQPRAFILPPPTLHNPTAASEQVTTMAKIQLRFDPSEESSQPPRLSSLSSKLKVSTFFASSPRPDFPNRARILFDMTQGMHSEAVTLSSRCVAAVEWVRHAPNSSATPSPIRRDSALSTSSTPTSKIPAGSSSADASFPFYTAQILVPLTLPHTKNLVPTFHSCLVSRQYAISLKLSLQSGTSTILRLPVQIAAQESRHIEEHRRRSEQQASAEQEADDAWRPRNIAPPPSDLLGASAIGGAPPVYEDLIMDTGSGVRRPGQTAVACF